MKPLAILFIVVFAATFSIAEEAVGISKIPKSLEPTLDECAGLMHVVFPTKTTYLKSRQIFGMDNSVLLKVEIEAKNLNGLIENSPFKGTKLSEERRYVNVNPRFEWWRPHSTRKFKSGRVSFQDNSCLCVLFDFDREGLITVYLEWFN